MELLLVFTLSVGVVVAGVLLTTRFLVAKSYEEVMREQRGDDLVKYEKGRGKAIKSGGSVKKKKKKRPPIVITKESHHSNNNSDEEEEVDGGGDLVKDERGGGCREADTTQILKEESTAANGEPVKKEKRKKRVEISDREESVEDHNHSPSRCCRRASTTSILTNRSESSPVAQLSRVKVLNHFDVSRPASDDVMKKRRSSQPLLLQDGLSNKQQSPHGNGNSNPSPWQQSNLATLLSSTDLSPDEIRELVDLLLTKSGTSRPTNHNHSNDSLIAELRNNLATAEERLQQTIKKLQNTIKELERERENGAKLEESYRLELDNTKRELRGERDKVTSSSTALRELDSSYKHQLQQLSTNTAALIKECGGLRAANSNLEQQLSISFKANREARLQSMANESKAVHESYTQKCDEIKTKLESDYLEREEHIRLEFTSKLDSCKLECDKLEKEKSDYVNRLSLLDCRERDLRGLLSIRDAELTQLKESLISTERRDSDSVKVRVLEEELRCKSGKLTELMDDNHKLVSMISSIEGESVAKSRELDSIRVLFQESSSSPMATVDLVNSKFNHYRKDLANCKLILANTDRLLGNVQASLLVKEGDKTKEGDCCQGDD